MKVKEIRELTTPEIVARITEDEDKLLRLRLNHAVSAIENPTQIRETRKLIARLNTILRERELQNQTNP
ncbi:MAG: 50S ribosomal protein L29 [Bacteroidetes bacterium]|jgi:large subunit ribosomal protein L29|nr:MAG: 50S ribosomal protein L29 [Bacteroidota bacterium]